ncbi:BON domain-containing protein [Chitinimonas sp. BJB300]|uniref:BON domain-containing protein n=1 Tax=Chitinimonas sp. BJB300 TaxID=1559339 RepID=UPI000C11224E|nr:BON domain-containing protein [Chitinimonas sp. BJB300]PHV10149.1 transporter [Chitinimonas sp. BJB300]TSJ86128.1 BON domain-containing protein [Chitinimonas sp. BJB300]
MNKSLITLALALSTCIGMSACAVTSGQSTVGQYVDDTTITTRVKARFAKDPQVGAMRINVETLKGIVDLSGFAVSETEKSKAGQIARDVPDVKDVRNNIIVKPPTS